MYSEPFKTHPFQLLISASWPHSRRRHGFSFCSAHVRGAIPVGCGLGNEATAKQAAKFPAGGFLLLSASFAKGFEWPRFECFDLVESTELGGSRNRCGLALGRVVAGPEQQPRGKGKKQNIHWKKEEDKTLEGLKLDLRTLDLTHIQ